MALALALPTGCGDDSSGDDELGDTGDDADGDSSGSTGEGSSDGSTDDADGSTDDADSSTDDADDTTDGSTDDADSSTDDADDTTEGTSSETGSTATTGLALLPSSTVVLEANNGGLLTSDCVLFEDGLPALDQPDVSLEITPLEGATVEAEGWSFAEFGTWTLSCSATVDGELLSAEQEIAVLNDALDPRIAAAGSGLGASAAALTAVLAANDQDDQLLVDAIAELEAVGPQLEPAAAPDFADLLQPVPNGYPTAGALMGLGIDPVADDDALGDAIAAVNLALDDFAATYAGFDPDQEPTQADLDQLTASGEALSVALDDMAALDPSAHGWLAQRQSFAALIRDHLVPAVDAANGYVVARTQVEGAEIFAAAPLPGGQQLQAPGQPGEDQPEFGLLSLSIGMFGQSNLRVQLINKWYGDVIADLDKSINNLILAEAIDYFWPPNANGPIVDLFQASSSVSFAVPGYDTWAYGSGFNSDPAYNLFLIFGDQWQGVVDNVLDSCGVSQDKSVFENVDAMESCVEDAEGAIDSTINYSMSVIEPGLLGGQDVHLGPFPEACSGFLPVATVIVPINLATGRGESILVNCLP
ncbi:hypothetical protein PPSIR1_04103 [Plesiocystis pacifica SIR-1]|uniref:Uncharacterized protein n=1 Tax=Plesiocystis pacifica SIR-1 TaxID=391625 RepID=A6G4H9_9BACT|nr:hypothetical protein [Plesiocystis pacifica]EDM79291.1 hypothetical protein PPSIR1_04103 [Plesiocystis pacifica SIR-1]